MANKVDKAQGLIEVQEQTENQILREQLDTTRAALEDVNFRAQESMANLDMMMDSRGWTDLAGYSLDGPSLPQVKDSAKKIRNLTGLNVHIGRGWRLRHSYVWAGGMHHGNLGPTGRGRTNVKNIVEAPHNQRSFFGQQARERQESACYTAGLYAVVGEDVPANKRDGGPAKLLHPLPVYQISGYIVDPDNPTEIWAIRRSWSPDGVADVNDARLSSVVMKHEWIYLNAHKSRETATVMYDGKRETVNRSKRVFFEQVNRLDGWTWGLPDAISAVPWADQYRRGVLNGLDMQAALASLAFKIKAQSAAGARNAATKVQSATPKGGTASMVDGMDVSALATAGSGYDFDSLRPVLSLVATAVDVSVVALSSDPGAAGSSYGSAATLDLPTKLSMLARRESHIELEIEVLKWFGVEDPKVWFDPIGDGAELYRLVQAVILKWNSGLYSPEEIKSDLEALFGHDVVQSIPAGVLIPNNEDSLPRRDIDTDSSNPVQAPSANQGVSNGTGGEGGNSGNLNRTDGIS